VRHLLSIRHLSAADLNWILAASEQPHPRPTVVPGTFEVLVVEP